ncbi:VOC family protein [Occultella aeris]|uniref:Glyoxalase-like domain protein n=1 Tax=Occultella aeris TaxID=2761496 RepID=A0A7M4DNX8_9MICO|nr:VOC family protein [Occultella aeris]VZO39164.1 Glyoxalase-like domain protein [Occultella aeris]
MGIEWMTAFLDLPAARSHAATRFWLDVTGCSLSERRGPAGEFATLLPRSGAPYLRTQVTGESEPRIHLDLHTGDVPGLVRRALDLGGTDMTRAGVPTVATPGGLLVCVVQPQPGAELPPSEFWPGVGRSMVDQVCLDVPPSRYDGELEFWTGLTGWARRDLGDGEFERLTGVGALQVLVQRRQDDVGPVRAHLDLAADDPGAEVARHLALGARHRFDGREWVTLEDPAGMPYCVTARRPGR